MKLLLALVLLGLAVATVVWWRSWRGRQRQLFIDTYPYGRLLDQRLAARRPELSAAQRALVFDGLREYFQLCREAKMRLVAMPSQVVDDAWHEFILFTRQYQQFCARGLGRFVHHTPAEAMRQPTDAQDGIKRAWRLSCKRQAIDPQAPSALPLLFALDATLAIGGGFIYQLDCLAAGQSAGSTPFCAGHIGCGGGCSGGTGSGDGGDSGDSSGCGGGD